MTNDRSNGRDEKHTSRRLLSGDQYVQIDSSSTYIFYKQSFVLLRSWRVKAVHLLSNMVCLIIPWIRLIFSEWHLCVCVHVCVLIAELKQKQNRWRFQPTNFFFLHLWLFVTQRCESIFFIWPYVFLWKMPLMQFLQE